MSGSAKERALVTGAGGFIGHHLVSFLKRKGHWVRGADIKPPEFSPTQADEFLLVDLTEWKSCLEATRGIDHLYALAADMGGMGYISVYQARILHSNALIDAQTIEAARLNGVRRYFYPSSACVYPEYRQMEANLTPLKEEDAYPAQPQDAYGWEKLFAERMCIHYREDYGLETRIARFHNIFGPFGTWEGGREKAPAAMCRKVAVARLSGDPVVEIWGDGEQTRSFCYIDDCLEGIYRLMYSGVRQPLNIGQDRMVTINQLAQLVAGIAGVRIQIQHVPGPMGVRGRNSDNTGVRAALGWRPQVSLEEGLARTYAWVEEQVRRKMGTSAGRAKASLRDS